MSPAGDAARVELAGLAPGDLPLVARWLAADHVRRYWGEPEECLRLLEGPPDVTHRAVIEAGGRKVGLVVWQHPSRKELDEAGLDDIPTSVADVDIMIGELDAIREPTRRVGPPCSASHGPRETAWTGPRVHGRRRES